jgi:acetyl esterase/lipase
LPQHKAENIGIYGCSAGAALTAQSLARFQDKGLPAPGAVGLFCSGVVNLGGDSTFLGQMLMGQPVPVLSPGIKGSHPISRCRYNSPLVMPATRGAGQASPTLLISGTRHGFECRPATMTVDASRRATVHVWGGVAFFLRSRNAGIERPAP